VTKTPFEMSRQQLGVLFNPSSIAFVGASDRSSVVKGMVARLKREGFTGQIWMINPKYREILGSPCFPSMRDLPQAPDLVVIALNAASVATAVTEASAAGAKAALVIATGFSDAGPQGRIHAERLREAVERTGILLCGPGSFGFAQPGGKASPFSAGPEGPMPIGNVGLVAQSGGFANLVSIAAQERGFGFSLIVAAGSEVSLTAADYLLHMVEHPQTEVLVAVVEEVRNVSRFRTALDRAADVHKPVIVLALGRSAAGQRATSAHSGALASRSDIQEAFLKRHGAIVVNTLDDLIETVVLLSVWGGRAPNAIRPLVVTSSGGDCSLVLDLADDIAVALPELGADTQANVHVLLPESTMIVNPIDLGTRPFTDKALCTSIIEAAAADPAINMVLARLPAALEDFPPTAAGASASGKPCAIFSRAALNLSPEMLRMAQRTKIPVLQGVDRALAAVKRTTDYVAWRERRNLPKMENGGALACGPAAAIGPLASSLSEPDALDLLRQFDVPAVEFRRAATQLGFPLAVKVDSPDIEHKTEAGGVRLNVDSPEELRNAINSILVDVRRNCPEAEIRGVILQPMLRPQLELIFGFVNDERFGPAVLVGLGGLLAEVLKRREIMMVPFSLRDAEAAISRLFGANADIADLDFRGLDLPAAARALARFSVFAAAAAPFVEAIDINPIGVFRDGRGALALDALIRPKARSE
jgi:acyl-CoA synthetase (NDP forming)